MARSCPLACKRVPYRVAVIEWSDSCRIGDGWMDAARVPAPHDHLCVTVGFVLAENDQAVVLAPTFGNLEESDQGARRVCDPIQIPRSAILSERTLTCASKAATSAG